MKKIKLEQWEIREAIETLLRLLDNYHLEGVLGTINRIQGEIQ